MPPPPKVTPSKEMKTENIINLFDAAAAPDISVTSPTEVSDFLLSTSSLSSLNFTFLQRSEPFSLPSSGLFFLLFYVFSVKTMCMMSQQAEVAMITTTELQED